MDGSLFQYVLLLTGLLLIANVRCDKGWLVRTVTVALLAWTLLESGWTIFQTLRDGVSTYRYPFIIVGSFQNPAPFGALNAIGLAVAVASLVIPGKGKDGLSKMQYGLSLATLIPGSVMLIVSRSRAAWVGLLVALVVLLFRETRFKEWIRHRRFILVAAAAAVLLAGVGMFLMKKDSAIGRFHLWNMECRVIARHPLTGVGMDGIFKAYGDEQAAYFRQAERPAYLVRVAGSPVYVFNEYLKFGMAWGIGGLLLSIAVAAWVVWRLFRKKSVLAYGALVYALFAFASFPLSVVQLKILGTVFLAVALAPGRQHHPRWLLAIGGAAFCACTIAAVRVYPMEQTRRIAERTWRTSLWMELDAGESTALLQPLMQVLNKEVQYLYHYGYLLHETGAFEESNRVLQQGASLSCDPSFHTAMAQNHIALGNCEAAESELLKARWLVPSRILPLWMLMKMYADTGRTSEAIETGRTIRDMPVRADNPDMKELYDRAMALLAELQD